MKFRLVASFLLLSLLFVTCKHDILVPPPATGGNGNGNGNGEPPPVYQTCSPDTAYFVNAVLPIITSNCAKSGCHDSKTRTEGLVLDNYNGILRIVQPGSPSNSKLYQVITASGEDVMPPKPNQPLTADEIASIKTWIAQGARNNQCFSECDTTIFTYSGAVEPIMTTYCKGCHNANSLNGGVDLSTFNGVETVALNGKLVGVITHAAGYPPMPQGGNALPDCQIRQIEKWIESGAPNN